MCSVHSHEAAKASPISTIGHKNARFFVSQFTFISKQVFRYYIFSNMNYTENDVVAKQRSGNKCESWKKTESFVTHCLENVSSRADRRSPQPIR